MSSDNSDTNNITDINNNSTQPTPESSTSTNEKDHEKDNGTNDKSPTVWKKSENLEKESDSNTNDPVFNRADDSLKKAREMSNKNGKKTQKPKSKKQVKTQNTTINESEKPEDKNHKKSREQTSEQKPENNEFTNVKTRNKKMRNKKTNSSNTTSNTTSNTKSNEKKSPVEFCIENLEYNLFNSISRSSNAGYGVSDVYKISQDLDKYERIVLNFEKNLPTIQEHFKPFTVQPPYRDETKKRTIIEFTWSEIGRNDSYPQNTLNDEQLSTLDQHPTVSRKDADSKDYYKMCMWAIQNTQRAKQKREEKQKVYDQFNEFLEASSDDQQNKINEQFDMLIKQIGGQREFDSKLKMYKNKSQFAHIHTLDLRDKDNIMLDYLLLGPSNKKLEHKYLNYFKNREIKSIIDLLNDHYMNDYDLSDDEGFKYKINKVQQIGLLSWKFK